MACVGSSLSPTWKARATTLFCALVISAPGPPRAAAATPSVRSKRSEVLAEFPIERGGGALLIGVRIHGRDYRMIIDTGTNVTMFHAAHRAALGRPVGEGEMAPLAGGALKLCAYESPEIEIGTRLRLRGAWDVGCVDLRSLTEAAGEQVDGILGIDYLRSVVLSIDFDAGRLRFHSQPEPGFGTRIPLLPRPYASTDCPIVRAELDGGAPLDFLIDTGAVTELSGCIEGQAYDRLVKEGRLLDGDYFHGAATAGATIRPGPAGRLRGVSVAGFARSQLIFVRLATENSLGLGYLSRYFVAFDFPNRTMYLQPGKQFGRAELYDLSGIRLTRKNGVAAVESSRDGTASSRAGIRPSDTIMTIDGRSTRELSLFAVRRLFCVEGRHVLYVDRGGSALRVFLDLRRGASRSAAAQNQRQAGRSNELAQ